MRYLKRQRPANLHTIAHLPGTTSTMPASANALRESLSSGMKLEVAALTQVFAQAVATLAAVDGSTVSQASYLPPTNVRHRRGRGLLRG